MTPNQEIAQIKLDTFEAFKDSRKVWIIEERGADFIVHSWDGSDGPFGAGVGPASTYPTLRKAAARLMQLLHVGPVAPQTWPEEVCIGSIAAAPQS